MQKWVMACWLTWGASRLLASVPGEEAPRAVHLEGLDDATFDRMMGFVDPGEWETLARTSTTLAGKIQALKARRHGEAAFHLKMMETSYLQSKVEGRYPYEKWNREALALLENDYLMYYEPAFAMNELARQLLIHEHRLAHSQEAPEIQHRDNLEFLNAMDHLCEKLAWNPKRNASMAFRDLYTALFHTYQNLAKFRTGDPAADGYREAFQRSLCNLLVKRVGNPSDLIVMSFVEGDPHPGFMASVISDYFFESLNALERLAGTHPLNRGPVMQYVLRYVSICNVLKGQFSPILQSLEHHPLVNPEALDAISRELNSTDGEVKCEATVKLCLLLSDTGFVETFLDAWGASEARALPPTFPALLSFLPFDIPRWEQRYEILKKHWIQCRNRAAASTLLLPVVEEWEKSTRAFLSGPEAARLGQVHGEFVRWVHELPAEPSAQPRPEPQAQSPTRPEPQPQPPSPPESQPPAPPQPDPRPQTRA